MDLITNPTRLHGPCIAANAGFNPFSSLVKMYRKSCCTTAGVGIGGVGFGHDVGIMLFCFVVLRPLLTATVMSGRSVNLTTLFLGRLRPPKQLTSTLCIYFHQ